MFITEPFYSPRPWGYELWTLSTHREGCSLVLPEKENLLYYLGHSLPILIKIIKADEDLSVQVHPADEYARIHENDNGKTECWYIVEAEKGAKVLAGLKPGLNREKMSRILQEGNVEEYLEYIPVSRGDMIYIPAGTVHAIMGGVKLFEIQESSDVTYRMYDWGRERPLHIEQSLDVIDYEGTNGYGRIENFTKLETPYFNVEKLLLSGQLSFEAARGFQTLNICHGSGRVISEEGQVLEFQKDQTVYIPRGTVYRVEGDAEILRTWQN